MNPIDFPAIDSHVHIRDHHCLPYMQDYRVQHHFEAVNIACLAKNPLNNPLENILAALLKLNDPHFYAHATLLYPDGPISDQLFAHQAENDFAIGFDGIKMLEGKPTMRKKTGLPLDDPVYEPYFSFMEENGHHIIWHVADPETFWDKDKAPAFSFSEGWFYGDGSYPSKQQLYEEVSHVLARHPKLNVTFAHFFFLSDFPEEAEALMQQYQTVTLDITPGREMYENFSKRPAYWRDFFHRYADRILFGTDMTRMETQGSASDLIAAMKRFLATEDVFSYWDFNIHGLGLSQADCTRIGKINFTDRVRPSPRPIDPKALRTYIDRQIDAVPDRKEQEFILHQCRLSGL